jgi:DNA modification methylase
MVEKVIQNNLQEKEPLIRGFIFACTKKPKMSASRDFYLELIEFMVPLLLELEGGDLLFLNNVDTDVLYGVFKAVSDGGFKIEPKAWKGRYPYQVKVEPIGQIIKLNGGERILNKYGVKRNTPLLGKKLLDFLDLFLPKPLLLDDEKQIDLKTVHLILKEKEKILKRINEKDIEDEIPLIESTTFWDFPRQSYGITPKGDNKYPGVTPALIIYNMIWRYTDVGDLVVDPMAGSGTTYDVCKEEKRRCICYDIAPTRPEVIQNDSRKIPLDDNSVDMIFVDSPYGDNIRYNDHPNCIGKISSETEEFYDELEKVMRECHRILKPGKVIGWLIGDQWVKNRFTPVGFRVYQRLCKYFEPLDIICVARRGQASHTGIWHNRARRFNFFLRGFKYLLIMRKPFPGKEKVVKPRIIEWTYYERERRVAKGKTNEVY